MRTHQPARGSGPAVITVPGLGGSGPAHWQTLWEQSRPDTTRAELGSWDAPLLEQWVTRLDEAVRRSPGPVILAAHSLGCITVAWWARRSPPNGPVAAALLVAPADVDRADAPGEVRGFAPIPATPLPFPSILVASADDPWVSVERARAIAAGWGSRFVAVGPAGHLNAASGLGLWPMGMVLLDRLVADATPPCPPGGARRADATPAGAGG